MNDFYLNAGFGGLGTFSVSAPNAGPYFVEGKLSIPTLSNGGGQSAVTVTVKQATVTKYSGAAGNDGFRVNLNCAANDLIEVIFASANAVDAAPNAVKSTISIGQGV